MIEKLYSEYDTDITIVSNQGKTFDEDEIDLNRLLNASGSHFMVSTWHSNKYRTNAYINTLWQDCNSVTKTHFYHVGAKEENRNEMLEALILSYQPNEVIEETAKLEYMQLSMF